MAVLHRHATEPPEPPTVRAPERDITPALEAVVLRCLAKDREERFAGADEFVAALTAAAGAPGGAAPAVRVRSARAASGPSAPGRASRRPGVSSARSASRWRLAGDRAAAPRTVRGMARPAGGARGGRRGRPGHDAAPGGLEHGIRRGGRRRRGPDGAGRCATAPASAAATAPADAATAPPPTSTPPPPPPAAAWTLPGHAAGFDYTVRVTPRRVRAGRPFQLEIAIRPGSSQGPWRPGEVRAGLTVLHDRRVELRGEFPLDDAGRLFTRLTLPRNGVHQVELALRGGRRELASDSFALCVGADLEPAIGQRSSASARRCPRSVLALRGGERLDPVGGADGRVRLGLGEHPAAVGEQHRDLARLARALDQADAEARVLDLLARPEGLAHRVGPGRQRRVGRERRSPAAGCAPSPMRGPTAARRGERADAARALRRRPAPPGRPVAVVAAALLALHLHDVGRRPWRRRRARRRRTCCTGTRRLLRRPRS